LLLEYGEAAEGEAEQDGIATMSLLFSDHVLVILQYGNRFVNSTLLGCDIAKR